MAAEDEPARCGVIKFAGHRFQGSVVDVLDRAYTERYSSLLSCAGQRYLFSRRAYGVSKTSNRSELTWASDQNSWETIVRVQQIRDNHTVFGRPALSLTSKAFMSHNAAFTCLNGQTIIGLGGRDRKRYTFYQKMGWVRHLEQGVLMTGGWNPTSKRWSVSSNINQPLFDGHQAGCIEMRRGVHPVCEFDGRLSAATFKGKLFLYARANTRIFGSGRAVQVTSHACGTATQNARDQLSCLQSSNWSAFQQLNLSCAGTTCNDIYFAVVSPQGEHALAALYPATWYGCAQGDGNRSDCHMQYRGGIWLSFSRDGVSWSPGVKLMDSIPFGGRTDDHPVSWQAEVDGGVTMHVEHGVLHRTSRGLPDDPKIGYRLPVHCEYHIPRDALHGVGIIMGAGSMATPSRT